jgi:CNT family concentrative nucleoside transporter
MGIMQAVVQMMARFMRWTMGTSGAETLSCSANIFIGQTEAPLLIKPFLDDMTLSELHAVMVGGFATIAGGVLAGYISMGIDAAHLIAASVMAAPAALVVAKIMLPETEHSKTAGDVGIPDVGHADNLLDAAARGTTDGLKLAVNVGAMLIAFIALIGVVDLILAYFDKLIDYKLLGGLLKEGSTEYAGFFPGSLKTILGTLFSPLAFLMGVPWKESLDVGNLLGLKIAVNEFVAYAELGKIKAMGDLSPRAITIATYALCGFANFSSIGIQIGGIGALAPKRRSELSRIALRAMFAGAIVSWISASFAGMLI